MSGPAALKAVQGNNIKDVRRNLGFQNTHKYDITKEYYGMVEPELYLYIYVRKIFQAGAVNKVV
jgi:hypothetical protein